jgi:zinc transporter, ZIP family
VIAALGWGLLAASSLLVGAVLGMVRTWPDRLIGAVLAFGAGALISSVTFDLVLDGFSSAGALPVAIGLAAGALTFFLADRGVQRLGGRDGGGAAGAPLALGALLDGIPEQAVLGIGLAAGGGISISLLVAIFVSNLPEAIGSAADMRSAGRPRRGVLLMWAVVTVVCTLATLGGFTLADVVGSSWQAGIQGFAAGALLVMLTTSMIPEATDKAREVAGLVTVLGFAVAAGLSALS